MKRYVLAMILVASALSSGCALDGTSVEPETDSDSVSDALGETHGTEDLFALDLQSDDLTHAKIRTRFKTKPATLGRFVVGMRTRPCAQAYPKDTCGAWVASTAAVFPLITSGGLEHNFPVITTSGSLSVAFKSVMGAANTPVVHGSMTGLFSTTGSFFSTSQPIRWYFDHPVGSGGTAFYMQSPGYETNFLGFSTSAMNASRFVSTVSAIATEHNGGGAYEEREFRLYARLDAGETSVLRAEGEHLFVDWCKTDANGACLE